MTYASNTAANVGSAKLNVDGTMNVNGGLYVTNQTTGNTAYNNGYNYLTGTGSIVFNSALSNTTIYEEKQKGSDTTESVTVACVPIKGITDYEVTTDNGQTDYNSLTQGTWYGMINESRVNVWSTSRAILSYDANGGAGTAPDSVAKPTDKSFTVAANTFTAPANKVFTGWNTKADGSGNSYQPNASVSISADTTLYAQWTALYTVTWKNADGTVLETDENVLYGTTPEYNGATPTKEKDAQYSYTFAGWSEDGATVLETIPVVTDDVIYTAVFEEHSLERKHSLTLKGEIGVNFYIPKALVEDENSTATMSLGPDSGADHGEAVFEINNLTNEDKVVYHTSDEGLNTKNPLAVAKRANNDYYQFTAYVAAKQMADEIKLTITDSNNETVLTDTYRVANYCYEVINNTDGKAFEKMAAVDESMTTDKFEKLQTLCKSMLTYGSRAQTQFSYNTDDLADKDLIGDNKYAPESVSDFADYANETYRSDVDGMSFYGASMLLEAETTYSVWFRYEDNSITPPDATAKIGDKTFTVETLPVEGDYDANYVRYNILNLPANLLTKDIKVNFDGTENTYNVQTYFYLALQSEDPDLTNTVTSLYDYNQKAVAYFG